MQTCRGVCSCCSQCYCLQYVQMFINKMDIFLLYTLQMLENTLKEFVLLQALQKERETLEALRPELTEGQTNFMYNRTLSLNKHLPTYLAKHGEGLAICRAVSSFNICSDSFFGLPRSGSFIICYGSRTKQFFLSTIMLSNLYYEILYVRLFCPFWSPSVCDWTR